MISEIRPSIVLIENVALLRSRGLDIVLYDLLSIGYFVEWDVISAAAVGAPHLRERIWIVARPAELAQDPVYGEIARDKKGEAKSFNLLDKLPRSGRVTDQEMHELVPVAPRKTKRKDGWSYWVGERLFDGMSDGPMWPTAHGLCSTDRRRGSTDLSAEVLPADSAQTDAGSTASIGLSGCWPTPTVRLGASRGPQAKRFVDPARSNDLDDAVIARGSKGSLNPTWVSWLMGVPLWWTDLAVHNTFVTQVGWENEPLHVAPRVASGIPMRSQQLKALGNSVVWPCAYYALSRALAATEIPSPEVAMAATSA